VLPELIESELHLIVSAPATDDKREAGLRQFERDAKPDAAGPAGDQCDFCLALHFRSFPACPEPVLKKGVVR
jgi:hypothetical protein